MPKRLLIWGFVILLALLASPLVYADDNCDVTLANHARSDADYATQDADCLARAAVTSSAASPECAFDGSHYAEAVQLHDMGDYDRALRHYTCALEAEPDNAIIPRMMQNMRTEIAESSRAWSRTPPEKSTAPALTVLREVRVWRMAWFATEDFLLIFWRYSITRQVMIQRNVAGEQAAKALGE